MSRVKLVVFCVLALMATAVLAGDGHKDDEVTDDDPKSKQLGKRTRDVKLEIKDNKVSMESVSRTGKYKNKFQIEYSAEDGGNANSRVRVDMKAFTRSDDSDTKFRFQLKFEGIVEYKEVDGVAGLSSGDTVRSTLAIRGVDFRKDSSIKDPISNEDLLVFHGTSGDGVFTIRGYLNPVEFKARNTSTVPPQFHKFDIIINDFPYNDSTTSRLALIAKVRASQHDASRSKDDDGVERTGEASSKTKQVTFGENAIPFALFAWVNTVTINQDGNNTANVITSPMTIDQQDTDGASSGDINKLVAFSFDSIAPSNIEWDPEVGMGPGSVSAGGRVLPAFVLVLLSVVAAIFFA